MPVIKFDVSDQDPDESTVAPEPPPPGLYKAKIIQATPGYKTGDDGKPDKNAPRIEVIYQCLESADERNKDYKGAGRVWDYVTFYDTTKRQLDQFLQAIGVATKSKRSGQFDPEKQVGKIVKLRVYGRKGEENYRPQVGGVWKWDGAQDDGSSDDGLEDSTPAKAAKASKATKKAAPATEPDLETLGVEADAEDTDAQETLTNLATEAGVDPDDYPTWAELAAVLAEGGGGEEEAPEEEEGPTLADLGEQADGDDTDAQAKLTELAEANDIDPNDYDTWAEVATLLEEAGADPNDSGDPF